MYKKLKKQKGERFAQTIRNFHNGLLEIPDLDVIVRHAGKEAEPLLPYLMSLLATNDDTVDEAPVSANPFDLLDQAGYDAFYADTLEKQNSISKYFQKDELLCTFNDAARHQYFHIVHAVKKDVDQIKREDFVGKEKREDAYGTSVISIQMLKMGGFISIKNRYNHKVPGCDNTFKSNPDNIIEGLSQSLKDHFNVEFMPKRAATNFLPEGYHMIGEQVFKYYYEENGFFYGDRAWVKNGEIHEVDRSAGDARFDTFLFDNKTKTLKKIDPNSLNSFADDFNRYYGGNPGLNVQKGNLMLDGEVLIGAEESRIKTLYLPEFKEMSELCLMNALSLERFEAPALTRMATTCLTAVNKLEHFDAPKLTTMRGSCLEKAGALGCFNAPELETMGGGCLVNARVLKRFDAPKLTMMGGGCLGKVEALEYFNAPVLETMTRGCLHDVPALQHFSAPSLTDMGDNCISNAPVLKRIEIPSLTEMGCFCLDKVGMLEYFNAPVLKTMRSCLGDAPSLKRFEAPLLTRMGSSCLHEAPVLEHFNAPLLERNIPKSAAKCFTAPRRRSSGAQPSL